MNQSVSMALQVIRVIVGMDTTVHFVKLTLMTVNLNLVGMEVRNKIP